MMNLRFGAVLSAVAASALLFSCAKSESTSDNDAYKSYLDAWMEVNHPGVEATGTGIYVIDNQEGDGKAYNDEDYAIVRYTMRDLDGNITSTSEEAIAKQLGSYNQSYYYGPVTWYTGKASTSAYAIPVGVDDMLKDMKAGGVKTAVIPSWLMTYSRYGKDSEYFNHKTDYDNVVYTLTLEGFTNDILAAQVDSIEAYGKKYLGGIDSLSYGFYYKELEEPTDTNAFPSDTTVYIDYIGRLLNGQVFATTIKDTAKKYGLYSSSTTYEPTGITWGEDYSDLEMVSSSSSSSSSSSMITGFSRTLWEMREYGHSIGVFVSGFGYGYSGSGSTIPAYAPLSFEIWLVDEPED